MRFRSEFGLRSDEAYVRAVFADASASWEYGVPLLPAEAIELRTRALAAADVARVVRAYGASIPDTYAGEYIDAGTGTVYGLFTADTAAARAVITAQISPFARFSVLPARYSLDQLNATLAAASLDETQAWLAFIGAPFRGGSVRIRENDVWLLLGGVPADVDTISRYLGVERSMIAITVEPDVLAKLPRGSIRGQIVDARGLPVQGHNFDVVAIGDVSAYEPDGGTGISTDGSGSFVIERVAAIGWTVTIQDPLTGATLGSTHVVVAAGQESVISIRVAASD